MFVCSRDSLDWKDLKPAEIIKRVMKATTSGSILLFHTDKANTDEALPEVLRQLKEKGFEFVKASDLLYAEDYYIDSKGGQRLLSSEQPMMGSAVTEIEPLSSEISPTGGEPAETAEGAPADAPVDAPADIPVDAPAPAEIPAVTEAPVA